MLKRLLIPSDFTAARTAEQAVLEEVTRRGYGEASLFAIKLALEEGLNNAIRHGNGLDPKKKVKLHYDVGQEQVVIEIGDQGHGFDPQNVPDPTADENLEKPTGRGIMLMRAYMDEVHFNRQGNQVCMTKRRA